MKRVIKMAGFFLVLVLVLIMIGEQPVKAEAYLEPLDSENLNVIIMPGTTTHVSIPARSLSGALVRVYSITATSSSDTLMVRNLRVLDSEGEEITSDKNFYYYKALTIDFDIIAKDTTVIGNNTIEIKGSGITVDTEVNNIKDETLLIVTTYTPEELKPIQLTLDDVSYKKMSVIPDNSLNLNLTVKNEGDIKAVNTYLHMDYGTSGIIADYTLDNIKIGELRKDGTYDVKLPVRVLPSAKPGQVSIQAVLTCKDSDGEKEYSFIKDIYLDIKAIENTEGNPYLELTTEDNYKQLTPESQDTINVIITNKGESSANNIKLAVTNGFGTAEGITKVYTNDTITVDSIEAGETKIIQVPINIAKSLKGELYEITFSAKYTDSEANEKTPATMTMYVRGPEETVKDETVSNIVSINNVVQNPSSPVAGEKISVSFDITNMGNAPINDVRVSGVNLSSAGFEPVNSEPYTAVGTMEANESKRVTLQYMVGKKIGAGLGTLDIKYEYRNKNEEKFTESVQLYILNITNPFTEEKVVIGKPKLIINGFSTDEEILKAGNTFNFTFSLKNTHNVKAAKNIKLTVTQADGIFAPTEGSNIFYIEEINAGESSEQTINMKTRSDAATGDYDVIILVEYEYDDMSETDIERGGVSEENKIKLRATENYRPVLENIFIDSWNPVRVNQPADLSCEFYNMGKSTLGNVYITVEGDFCLANNSEMSYVGAVSGYGQEYITPQVIPLVEGEAHGILVVHFEDSNGEEQTISSDFTSYVEGEEIFDPGMYEDPFMGGDVPGMSEEIVEEDIMPLWVFIVTGAGGLLIALAITYSVSIKIKKNKLRRQYEAED